MSEREKEPRLNELLGKISQLEAVVEALAGKLESLARQEKANTEITDEHLKLIHHVQDTHHAAFRNVFERLRNVEAKLFPNLAADIGALQNIIGGGEDKVLNPLDYRKPKPE